jgi:hypothetical protein
MFIRWVSGFGLADKKGYLKGIFRQFYDQCSTERSAMTLLDNALGDNLADQGGLSCVLKALTRRVESLAHDPGGFVVEIGFIHYERQNRLWVRSWAFGSRLGVTVRFKLLGRPA